MKKLFTLFVALFATFSLMAQVNPGMRLFVKSPSSLGKEIVCVSASFGSILDLDKPVCGEAVSVLSKGNTTPPYPANTVATPITQQQACDSILNAAQLKGKIVMIRRGTCSFSSKCAAAEKAGALAVIVVNNAAGGGAIGMAATAGITVNIPCANISLEDGNKVFAELAKGTKVEFCMELQSRKLVELVGGSAYQTPFRHRDTIFPFLILANATTDTVKNVKSTILITEPSGKVVSFPSTSIVTPTDAAASVGDIAGGALPYFPPTKGTYLVRGFSDYLVGDTLRNEFVIGEDLFTNHSKVGSVGGAALSAATFAGDGKVANVLAYYYTGNRNGMATHATFGVANYAALKGSRSFQISLYKALPDVNPTGTTVSFGDLGELVGDVSDYTVKTTEAANSLLTIPLKTSNTKAGIALDANQLYILAVQYDGNNFKDSIAPAYTLGTSINLRPLRAPGVGTAIMTGTRYFGGGWNATEDPICQLHILPVLVDTKDLSTLEASEVKIAPNPVNNILNVNLDLKEQAKDVQIIVSDFNGRVLENINVGAIQSTNVPIDVSNYAAGTYFLTVKTDKSFRPEKFVKVN